MSFHFQLCQVLFSITKFKIYIGKSDLFFFLICCILMYTQVYFIYLVREALPESDVTVSFFIMEIYIYTSICEMTPHSLNSPAKCYLKIRKSV